jgi:hypothetical protein
MKMKHELTPALFFAGIFLLASCNSDSQNSDQSTDLGIPNYSLCVVDSFGLEIGDSLHMIGSIDDFCYHPNGSVIILDRAALRVRVIPNQEEPYFISGEGEGPGEMLYPQSVCTLEDGTVLVADEMKQTVMAFSSTGSYLGDFFTTDRYVPYQMFPVDSTSIVGSMLNLEMGDQVFFSFYIGRFNADSIPAITYNTVRWEWPAPQMYTDTECMEFTAGFDGRVFLAQDNTAYRISVFSPDGEELYSIENPDVNRIPKTPEEIEEEIVDFESWAREDQAYTGGYEPSPYHHLISLTGIDSEGNLWVERLGNEDEYQFDVWDEAGNLIRTASLSGYDEIDLLFSVDQYGILAAVVDPEHYPRIFKLELEMDVESEEE